MLLAALGCSRQPPASAEHSEAVSPQQNREPATATSGLAGFTVNVSLSEKARRKLIESKETVIVAGFFTGNPKPGALKQYVSEMDQVDLGEIKAEVAPGEKATFQAIDLKKDAFEQTDKQDPQLLINVFSGRKSSQNNLLDCGIYEGPLKPVQGGSIPISCKLIGE
jgi:hypothetical protein